MLKTLPVSDVTSLPNIVPTADVSRRLVFILQRPSFPALSLTTALLLPILFPKNSYSPFNTHLRHYLLREACLTSSPIPLPSELTVPFVVFLLLLDTDRLQCVTVQSWLCLPRGIPTRRANINGQSLVGQTVASEILVKKEKKLSQPLYWQWLISDAQINHRVPGTLCSKMGQMGCWNKGQG